MHATPVEDFTARLQSYTFYTVQPMMFLIVKYYLLLTSLARDNALGNTKVEEALSLDWTCSHWNDDSINKNFSFSLFFFISYLSAFSFFKSQHHMLLIVRIDRQCIHHRCRCVSDFRSRGSKFDPSPVPYFHGDGS